MRFYCAVEYELNSFATYALQSGADAKRLSYMLGHHSVGFTMNIYYNAR